MPPPPFPKPPTRAERRRWQQEDDADRRRHERPNVPPTRNRFTNCHDSLYLTHRFLPDRHGDRRCAFCRRLLTDCIAPGENA